MAKIKAISLFCGCGGGDLGIVGGFSFLKKKYRSTRIEIVHASDIDPRAVATYNLNFKHRAEACDIHDLSFKKELADLVIGGFPCQAFSTVNPTKKPQDSKNQLFWVMARIVEQIRPQVFIAENVKGFYRLGKGKYFDLAKDVFTKKGYNVFHKLIDASDFGVPQRRERLLMVGVAKKLNKSFVFPGPTHGEGTNGLKPKVPLRAVVNSIVSPDAKYYFSERAVLGVKRAKPNMKRAVAQNLDGQCLTITSHLAKVSLNSRDPVLLVDPAKELYRRFTPSEAARIQSFPDRFVFAGSEGDAYRQIGNAIPPVVMWHIINAITKQIFSDS